MPTFYLHELDERFDRSGRLYIWFMDVVFTQFVITLDRLIRCVTVAAGHTTPSQYSQKMEDLPEAVYNLRNQ
jgi:hypothetical protein